jgi:hypothetical protein
MRVHVAARQPLTFVDREPLPGEKVLGLLAVQQLIGAEECVGKSLLWLKQPYLNGFGLGAACPGAAVENQDTSVGRDKLRIEIHRGGIRLF